SLFSAPNSTFSIKSKSPISLNRVRMIFARLSTLCNFLAFLSACSVEDHSNPGTLGPLNPLEPHRLT
ncbi:MAG: hypothetical protein KJO26_01705, partial [Deltaproteobacteria bacterium]|nr:hypothetical protein [Deltaproteobacteria bacterium]